MSSIFDLLTKELGGQAVDQISRQIGDDMAELGGSLLKNLLKG